MKKLKIRKNPSLDDFIKSIIGNSKYNYVSKGQFAQTFVFNVGSEKIIDSVKIYVGRYLLKIFIKNNQNEYKITENIGNFYTFHDFNYFENCITYFKTLSSLGLIPKIYIINNYYMIMKYIESESLYNCKNKLNYEQLFIVLNNISKLMNTWHTLGFAHGDLNVGNILITKNLRVFFVDPSCEKNKFDSDIARLYRLKSYIES